MDLVVKKHFESKGHRSPVYGLAHYVNGQILSGGGEGWITSWNIADPENGRLIAQADTSVFCLNYFEPAKLILAGDRNGVLYFIENTGNVVKKYAHQGEIFALNVVGEYLYSIGKDGWLVKWDLHRMDALQSIQLSYTSLRSFVHSEKSGKAYIGDSNGIVHILDLDTMASLLNFQAHDSTVFSLELNEQNKLISGGKDAHLRLWDTDKFTHPLVDHPAHWFSVYAIRRHPTLPVIATASRDKQIRIWNADNIEPILTLGYEKYQGHIRSVNNLLWTDNGRYLVSAGDDAVIIFWEFDYFQ